MIQGHGGNIYAVAAQLGCLPEDILDMSSNINPLGSVPGLIEHLQARIQKIRVLPDVDGKVAVRGLASLLAISEDHILPGAGTTQFIYSACRALNSQNVLIIGPTYSDYRDACRMHDIEPDFFIARDTDCFAPDLAALRDILPTYDTVFLCNPNNPTGHLISHDQLRKLCLAFPETRFIIDESYLPFALDEQGLCTDLLPNVLVLWSVSKIFGIPGLRTGFLVASPEILASFAKLMQPWCINSLAQEAMDFLGKEKDTVNDFLAKTHSYLVSEKQTFCERLQGHGLTIYRSATSYLLMKLSKPYTSELVCSRLKQKRILIRDCANFHGLDNQFIRIALKDELSNRRITAELIECLSRGT